MATIQSHDRLNLAEHILSLLRPLAHGTDLWHDSAWNTNEMPGPGVPFHALVLNDDVSQGGADEHERFLNKHWLAAAGEKADPTAYFVAREAGPRWLTLRTYSRLGYLQALSGFTHALNGLAVSLTEDRGWTWDLHEKTVSGDSLYRVSYKLSIALDADKPFDAAKWLRTAAQDVCEKEDPRADCCAIQLVRDARVDYGHIIGYERTRSGFVIDCETEKVAHKIRDKVFPDCKTRVAKGKTRHDPVLLHVAFA